MVEKMADSTENKMALTMENLRIGKWEGLLERVKVEQRVDLKGRTWVGSLVERKIVSMISLLAVSMGEKTGMMRDS